MSGDEALVIGPGDPTGPEALALPEADVVIDGAQIPAVMMRELLERVCLD